MPAIPPGALNRGSAGTSCAKSLRRHPVWAITRRKNEAMISAELQRAPLPKLRMIYFDLPKALLVWKKGQAGIEAYYRLWQRHDSWAGGRSPS